MDLISILVYGIIQGLTEFLPVSSSGHLALLPGVLNVRDPGVTFDLAMHVGTALSVAIYFHRPVFELIRESLTLLTGKKGKHFGFLLNMLISTVVTVVLGLFIKDIASSFGRQAWVIGLNLAVFGILLGISDMKESNNETVMTGEKLWWKQALGFGLFQTMAIFPGVSRSGATILFGRFLRMSRRQASEYSFLMSLPIIVGGFIYKVMSEEHLHFSMGECFGGITISFITGILTIHFFLKFVERISLWAFSIYRIVLAIAIWLLI